jgi:hypothetical protein
MEFVRDSISIACVHPPKPDTLEGIILIHLESQRGRTLTSWNRSRFSFHYSERLVCGGLHAVQARRPNRSVVWLDQIASEKCGDSYIFSLLFNLSLGSLPGRVSRPHELRNFYRIL